jgi:hypothetical protein
MCVLMREERWGPAVGFADPAARASLPKVVIDHQVIFYPLLMLLARLSWALQSALYVARHPDMPAHTIESITIAGHWIGYV